VLSGDFVLNGKTTLKSIRDTDPRELERVSCVIYTRSTYILCGLNLIPNKYFKIISYMYIRDYY